MIFAMGLDLTKPRERAEELPGSAMLAINDFSRDKVLFDSGAARSVNNARVPIAGVGPEGASVEIRIIEETGNPVTPWIAASPVENGRWSGFLNCPLQWFWMRIEARITTVPEDVVMTENRFGVGHVISLWSGASATQYWSNTPAVEPSEPIASIMDHVIDLKENRRTNGCQWAEPFKKPGIDELPEGCSLNGLEVSINADTSFQGWDFTGYMLKIRAVISLRNCILGERDGSTGLLTSLDFYGTGGYEVIEYCDFIGCSQEDGQGLFLKVRTGANNMVEWPIFQRNRLWGFQSDGIKPNKGLVAFNYFDPQENLNMVPIPYNDLDTYPAGTLVLTERLHVFRALTDVTGITPPTSKTGASDVWLNLDPHADLMTVDTCVGGCVIRGNYFNRDPGQRAHSVPGRGVTGINNAVRMVRNNTAEGSGVQYDTVTMEYNYITGEPGGYPFPLQAKSGTNPAPFADPVIRHNVIEPPLPGDLIHPDTGRAILIWHDNRNMDGSEGEIPENSVPGTTLPLETDDMVQLVWHDRENFGLPGVQHAFAGSVPDLPPEFSAIANGLIQTRPGERYCIVNHTVGNGSLTEMVGSLEGDRKWADELALHHFATSDGQGVGLACTDWPHQIDQATPQEIARFRSFLTGKAEDGSSLNLPVQIGDPATGASLVLNHLATELYDPSVTTWLYFGSERSDIIEDMRNGVESVSGAPDIAAAAIEQIRLGARQLPDDPSLVGLISKAGPEITGYATLGANGQPGSGPDGRVRHARLSAHAVAHGLGHLSTALPEFDRCLWDPSGAYVELWWSGGRLTTTRIARAKPSLPATYSHWTQVFGFEINGMPANRAEIVDGKIRIYPATGTFTSTDQIQFGRGRGTGEMKYPEDNQAESWQDLPIADLGLFGLEGVTVRPLPDPAVLANTLAI